MSADAASPSRDGVGVIGDRYRLVERISHDATTTLWLAHDQLLARPVSLTVHSPGGDAAREFLGRAHRLSTLTHPGLARVYDAVDEGERAYVVSEWVDGARLTDVLAEGPLDPVDASAMVGRVAEAVSHAHAVGVALGGLHPDHVRLTRRGTVFARVASDRATTADDIRGLGGLLYAALTAAWPLSYAGTGSETGLRPAATLGGRLSSPRQVRGGVPHDLSTLAMRALQPEDPRGIRTAEAVATVLGERASPERFDEPMPYVPQDRQPAAHERQGYPPPPTHHQQQPPHHEQHQPAHQPPELRQERYGPPDRYAADPYGEPELEDARRSRLASVTAVVAAIVALAVVGWLIGLVLGRVPDDRGGRATEQLDLSNAPTSPNNPTTTGQAGATLRPTDVQLFDPQGDGEDNPNDVAQAIDGNPQTAWTTVNYRRSAKFGNLKDGLGILIDMGRPVAVSEVTIHTTKPGVDLEIRAGDTAGDSVDSYQVVGQAVGIQAEHTVSITNETTEHRYWLVWLTKLAPSEGEFQASLDEVQFQS